MTTEQTIAEIARRLVEFYQPERISVRPGTARRITVSLCPPYEPNEEEAGQGRALAELVKSEIRRRLPGRNPEHGIADPA